VEKPTWSEEKVLETDLSQGPTFSSPKRPALGQEAQGDYTPDWTLGPAGSWQILPDWQAFPDCPGPDMAPSQQAIVSRAGSLQKNLTKRDQEWDKMEKLLGRFPNLISTGVRELVQQRDAMANRIQELEEKRSSLEKECKESQ
jgi:hypothetical protein